MIVMNATAARLKARGSAISGKARSSVSVARSFLLHYVAIHYVAIEHRKYGESATGADPRRGIASFSTAVFEAAAGSILVHIVLAAGLQ